MRFEPILVGLCSMQMARYIVWFVIITGCIAQEDMDRKVFLFPKETATAFITLKPEQSEPLKKFTVCLQSYTQLTREHSLFSLANSGTESDNTFLIYLEPPNYCMVYINQEEIRFRIDSEVLELKHTCASWDSDTGVVQLWINGKAYPRRVSNKGFTILAPYSIILGQEQDSYGGGFDAKQSFVGEISDVHMWDYVLTFEDINNVLSNVKNGNVVSWKSLWYESKGEVFVQPKLQCTSWGYSTRQYYPCS
ncbi:Hypothetical predicted protein [Pelobates cultripes]|uniref:Pentraxin family member n=1 Tax=Pelobates cultripes TaxID=61616 RepID=A0AAD1TGI9_PELCU|nr:Hypothetical predicted protein [Pelobates cultripes]CAH2326768.1 Hypothetical predicted protein [Pelobates cultripes]